MVKVIGVRFRQAGKIYYFSPGKLKIRTGDHVIVETARGLEYGYVVIGNKEVDDREEEPAAVSSSRFRQYCEFPTGAASFKLFMKSRGLTFTARYAA